MAQRREVGTGPRVEESVDMVMEMGGRCGAGTTGQVCVRPQSLKSVRFLVFGCLANIDWSTIELIRPTSAALN
jgi:hypothetical protein